MTAPSSPYSTPQQVSYLLQNRFYASIPSSSTVPSDEVIENLITWTDGVIEMAFHAVGYKLPWAEISGETWPAAQTTLLQFMSALGAAAMAGGHILQPAPMMGPGQRGSQANVYATSTDKMLAQIKENGYRFRAQYYEGTNAEKWIADKYGPRMDFLEDWWDPTRYWMLHQYTEELHKVFNEMTELDIDWDYLYNLRAATAD
jgi:hypothetical protein